MFIKLTKDDINKAIRAYLKEQIDTMDFVVDNGSTVDGEKVKSVKELIAALKAVGAKVGEA